MISTLFSCIIISSFFFAYLYLLLLKDKRKARKEFKKIFGFWPEEGPRPENDLSEKFFSVFQKAEDVDPLIRACKKTAWQRIAQWAVEDIRSPLKLTSI